MYNYKIVNLKNILSLALITCVIFLHGVLRLSEIPYSINTIGQFFYVPSINFAAGKGFTEDTSFLKQSPELTQFYNSIPPLNIVSTEKFSLSATLSNYTDYTATYKRTLFVESVGYRVILGLVWKCFGFNWYFVGLLNYLFSLIALLSLMYCSYRILGITYSLAIGAIFSVATPEIRYVAVLARDAFPLWFACYLICALTLFTSKSLTFTRITGYATLIGIIIYASIQGRISNIYFLPLVTIIYFVHFFFFQKKEISFILTPWLTHPLLEKIFLFSYCTSLTFFFAFILQYLTYISLNIVPTTSGFMHVIFIGLGCGQLTPPLLRYSDGQALYLAEEYSQRVLDIPAHWKEKCLQWLIHVNNPQRYTFPRDLIIYPYADQNYNNTLREIYFLILKTYPFSFFRDIFLYAFSNTLLHLASPFFPTYGFSKVFYPYIWFIIKNNYLFFTTIIGGIILYFKFKLKEVALILVTFILYNAGLAFIQLDPRHVLMGHPSYYFLSGVTIGFVFDQIRRFFIFSISLTGFSPKQTIKILTKDKIPPTLLLKKITSLRISHKYLFKLIFLISTSVFFFFFLYKAYKLVAHVEGNNIYRMQIFFDSLNKHPLTFETSPRGEKIILIPPALRLKTIGIFCEMGQMKSALPIHISSKHYSYDDYVTTIFPRSGKNVILFFPLYHGKSVKFEDSNQCKSFCWSDLKDWKGPLWEGTYDQASLKK